jgi:hypothetical protein
MARPPKVETKQSIVFDYEIAYYNTSNSSSNFKNVSNFMHLNRGY